MLALNEAVERHELWETVKVNGATCLGPCRNGAVLVVYPESTWYGGVTTQDIDAIVGSHLREGRPVDRLRLP